MKTSLLDIITDRKWFVGITKELHETRVAGYLSRKNIESFIPRTKIKVKSRDGSHSIIQTAILPGILFIFANEAELMEAKNIGGINGFLFWLNSYAIISPEDIRAISEFCRKNTNIKVEKCSVVAPPQPAIRTISKNDYADYIVGSRNINRVRLSSLGYTLSAGAAEHSPALHHAV